MEASISIFQSTKSEKAEEGSERTVSFQGSGSAVKLNSEMFQTVIILRNMQNLS